MADASSFAPPSRNEPDQAARGRPFGVGSYASAALTLLDHGYEPLPIKPASKAPAPSRWSRTLMDEAVVEQWAALWPGHGVGLRTGRLVGVDIDILNADLAHEAETIARRRLGDTPLLRIGLWPKRLLVYRTETPFAKMSRPGLEILGLGQQFVAFGIHPDTRQPYDWPLGDTPLDVARSDLPAVSEPQCEELLAEIAALAPQGGRGGASGRRTAQPTAGPVRDETGRVVDGRDAWLSIIAFHAVHDAAEAGELSEGVLVGSVWRRFEATTDLGRPMKDGGRRYREADAAAKVRDKLRLLRDGRLPPRRSESVDAAYEAPNLSPEEARGLLDAEIRCACREIETWHGSDDGLAAPQIGIRATVGLGKSAAARRCILALRERLRQAGKPDRIVVLGPSHALLEEIADNWRRAGADVAVLRGYEARDPASGRPMCLDPEAVRNAVAAGEEVQSTACERRDGRRCAFLDNCGKQRNRREVAGADVVVAAYDALYTGFAIEPSSIALLLVDEGCWARAQMETGGLWVETFASDQANAFRGASRRAFERQAADLADLTELRSKAARALSSLPPGPIPRARLLEEGLSAEACRFAASIEERRLRDPGLYPGMPKIARGPAMELAKVNARIRRRAKLWRAFATLIENEPPSTGGLRIGSPDPETGLHEIVASGVKAVHPNFGGLPVLHLDATLRPHLARRIFPQLQVIEIDATAPNMRVRLFAGAFGKSAICPDDRSDREERRRREKRLAECVDHVRWQARSPGRILVVTYKDCESAFAGVPGVEVAHFNAIAGLDAYKDVRLLVVVGRPLPPAHSVQGLVGAFFGGWPRDRYVHVRRGVRMRDGSSRGASVVECEDAEAEVLRAAICDDELIQAVGRGRGVNRTVVDPLEVHVLSDVALPLVHDEVQTWERVAPDLLQRMLLEGVAADSPADAAALHPSIFGNAEQAKKAFERSGFKGHFPMRDSYRGLSLKSAAYRRPGRGRGWQRAWWIEGGPDPRDRMISRLGSLACWTPDA